MPGLQRPGRSTVTFRSMAGFTVTVTTKPSLYRMRGRALGALSVNFLQCFRKHFKRSRDREGAVDIRPGPLCDLRGSVLGSGPPAHGEIRAVALAVPRNCWRPGELGLTFRCGAAVQRRARARRASLKTVNCTKFNPRPSASLSGCLGRSRSWLKSSAPGAVLAGAVAQQLDNSGLPASVMNSSVINTSRIRNVKSPEIQPSAAPLRTLIS